MQEENYAYKGFTSLFSTQNTLILILGYLNKYRRWYLILDLTDLAALIAAGYMALGHLHLSNLDLRLWGLRMSSNVKEKSIKLEGAADVLSLGLPADIKRVLQYTTNTDFGAVLICDDEVIAEGYEFPDPFRAWLLKNSGALLVDSSDLKKHGVCTVTWTYCGRETVTRQKPT